MCVCQTVVKLCSGRYLSACVCKQIQSAKSVFMCTSWMFCVSLSVCVQLVWVLSILCAWARIGLSVTEKWGGEGDDRCLKVRKKRRECERDGCMSKREGQRRKSSSSRWKTLVFVAFYSACMFFCCVFLFICFQLCCEMLSNVVK